MSGGLFSMANVTSFTRAALAPPILVLLAVESQFALYGALAIALMAAASDFADGYIARRQDARNEVGRYLDSACDAIFNLAVFLGFLANDWLAPAAFAAIYFAEIVVPYLGAFAKQLRRPVGIRWSARTKTIVHPLAQIIVIGMAALSGDPTAPAAVLALAAAVAASVLYVADHAVFAVRYTFRPA